MKRFLATLTFAAAFCGVASADDIPLRNWAVPAQGSGQLSTLADVGYPAIFVGVTPCRVADTRNAAGPYGGPLLSAGVPRTFNIVASGCTGIPSGVTAFSLNFTAVNATGNGMILAWPAGGSQPSISILNYVTGQTIANAAIVPAGSGTSITVVAGSHATNLIIDINGYFIGGGGVMNTGPGLALGGSYFGGPILSAINSAALGYGIQGRATGTLGGSVGVYGEATGATGATYGVFGISYGAGDGGAGVFGHEAAAGMVYGIKGMISSASAMKGAAGVYGVGADTTAITSGVLGESLMTINDSAGVIGRDATTLPAFTNVTASAGLRGESTLYGVVGMTGSTGRGVAGFSLNGLGILGPWGFLGSTTWGVYANGNVGASGTKPFVEPHPYKPGIVIRYVALEGPEAGTYFRGRGRFVGGSAVIEVPESFRLVTDEEGITVQITPIGHAAAVGVTRIGLDFIEAESTRDLEFSYLVQGIRKTFKDWQVEVASQDFMPMFPTSTIPSYLSEGQKRNLIQAGVYNEDGTVNMATARRLGWDKVWEKRGKGEAR